MGDLGIDMGNERANRIVNRLPDAVMEALQALGADPAKDSAAILMGLGVACGLIAKHCDKTGGVPYEALDTHEDDDEPFDEEPSIDVCQGCGAYFSWKGVARQKIIAEKKLIDGARLQRCYKCLEDY